MPGFTPIRAFAAALAIAAITLPCPAAAQQSQMSPPPMMDHEMPGMMQHHMDMQGTDMPGLDMHGTETPPVKPTLMGQDAFAAIQEIVQILEADPRTDWSKVDLEALRQHLIDMNEVTLKAAASPKAVDGGLEIVVTGGGRTVDAIQRMVTAHANFIERTHLNGWNAKVSPLPDGVLLTVTASNPKETQHIRGLGFIGILASGHHHHLHHLAMARGEMTH
jgi:hypothetical protein